MIERLRRDLAAKLLAGQMLVVLAGGATLLIAVLAIAPGVFHHHVRDALGVVPADVARHLDHAYWQSALLALGIAMAAAILTAIGLSWLVSRRVVAPIRRLSAAAGRIAHGAYVERVPAEGSDELAALAASFNEMAGSLESAERRRRELLSDVAHELRTPLATIEAHVEGLADGVIAPDDRAWTAMSTDVGRLARLVDDLQRVSRAEERQLDLHLRPLDPADLVAAAIAAAGPAYAAKGVELDSTIDPRAPTIVADADRMREVLGNLLDNALRHTPPAGRVRVLARPAGPDLELAVSDTGDGIAAELLDRVFERFFRVDPGRDRSRGGSGIGLAITRALVDAHDGTIAAESAGPGTGTTFRVVIPVGRFAGSR